MFIEQQLMQLRKRVERLECELAGLRDSRAAPVPPVPDESLDHFEKIITATAAAFDVSKEEMLGRRRTRRIYEARAMAMWACRRYTELSSPTIGELFRRDHATVLHAVHAVEALRATATDFVERFDEVTRACDESAPNSPNP